MAPSSIDTASRPLSTPNRPREQRTISAPSRRPAKTIATPARPAANIVRDGHEHPLATAHF
ncbi:MAG: hypothetical protein IPL47_12855 [Phyllobacteriaceae bacterium]|nr:hypothetical protein [Phyllobacteriaceae bacterium]